MTFMFPSDRTFRPATPSLEIPKKKWVPRTRREEWEDENDLYITLFRVGNSVYRMNKAAPLIVLSCACTVAFWWAVGHGIGIW